MMKNPVRSNVLHDDVSYKASKEIKAFSTSALLRWMLKALTTDDKQWSRLLRSDPEIKAVQEWIRPKLRKALMLSDKE